MPRGQVTQVHSERIEEPGAAVAEAVPEAILIPKVTLVVPHRANYCSVCKTTIKGGNMARHMKEAHRFVGFIRGV